MAKVSGFYDSQPHDTRVFLWVFFLLVEFYLINVDQLLPCLLTFQLELFLNVVQRQGVHKCTCFNIIFLECSAVSGGVYWRVC